MSCASAEELQARLALRALCQSSLTKQDAENSTPTTSTFHQKCRAETDDVLKSSLDRRLKKVQRQVDRLVEQGSNGSAGQENINPKVACNGSTSPVSVAASRAEGEAQTQSSGSQDYWVDQNKRGDILPVTKFVSAFEKAYLHTVKSGFPADKRWGPSRRQRGFEDPPYKDEEPKKEIFTIKSGLQALNQSLTSREKQIASLKKQIENCQEYVKDEDDKLEELEKTLRTAQDPAKLPQVHESRRKSQQESLEKVEKELQRVTEEAERHRNLVKQQEAFFHQSDTIFSYERGTERIGRSPAGEIFLVPHPPSMDDDKAENRDVGTAVANPYEVDSWPFEPNVLARRTPKECPLDCLQEETLEEMMDANRPRTPPSDNDESDEDDDDDRGPPATSRSL